MNTDKDKLQAYRETMRRGDAAWQSGQPKYVPLSSTEEDDLFKTETPTKENYYDRVPGLKKVNELQFGDIYRMQQLA